jgi:hypothetical protein
MESVSFIVKFIFSSMPYCCNCPNVSLICKIHTPKRSTYTFLIFMDPCIVDDSVEKPTRCSFVMEFIIPKSIEGSTCFERHTAHHQEL